MTNDLISLLMQAGLTKAQATSVTAAKVAEALIPEDSAALVKEATREVNEARKLIEAMKAECFHVSDMLRYVKEATEEYGGLTDERAKNAIALYSAVISATPIYMREKNFIGSRGNTVPQWEKECSFEKIVEEAGYITYAYLTGQVKQEIVYNNSASGQETYDSKRLSISGEEN